MEQESQMAVTTDVNPEEDGEKPKSSKLPIIIGLVLAIVGGAAGFFGVKMGLIPLGSDPEAHEDSTVKVPPPVTEDVVFVPLDPLTISMPPGSSRRLLRIVMQMDVVPSHAEEVEKIKPRIADVLNSYLRALYVEDFEAPAAMTRIRAQMLHRIQVVAGPEVVRDLLILEFVLN